MTRPLRRVDHHGIHPFRDPGTHGWVEPCPYRCGAEYWIPDQARHVPDDRWDAHLVDCPSRPRLVVPTMWHREDDEPTPLMTWQWRAPRAMKPAAPPVVCWCRDDVIAHLRGGCIRSGCLCLDPPELVRWAAEHPRTG